ncbi:transcription factor HY5 [Marchantia polymorpha subsp. ruderalis]|uniref:BZIP domain-containing protein n=2 Tax=Marchantia polymorpha TaxID=3197 RepID=A0AAF6AQZ6_MARPO|nr:hypothetical protein MARPO_0001s0021 [Marchantia polymorpha]BBM98866.1 hypothetical protein Mp_1g16800 [Marchantia polymorpha subsp. ruderalis]|eukprot:PTQ49943.1 hypothetical protein MARPO_0001s0021 [Marchantia polymorpha]
MNEVESQEAEIQWVDSDVDNDSDASDSDGTDGEVPDVTDDTPQTNLTNNPLPPGAVRLYSKPLNSWNPKSPIIATSTSKESPFAGGWKPVIDGKIQVGGEGAVHKGRSSPMQVASAGGSSQKQSSSDGASPSPAATGTSEPKKDGNESDSDVRRVPELMGKSGVLGATSAQPQGQTSGTRTRKRGGASADKEHKRLKRLLRNRVSAQQARERKKAYLSDLEVRSKELQQRNEELEEKVSTLQRENYMLRQIVKNTALKKTGGDGPTGMQ